MSLYKRRFSVPVTPVTWKEKVLTTSTSLDSLASLASSTNSIPECWQENEDGEGTADRKTSRQSLRRKMVCFLMHSSHPVQEDRNESMNMEEMNSISPADAPPRRQRKPSRIEIIDDELSGRLTVPVYDDLDSGPIPGENPDPLPRRDSDGKLAPTVPAFPLDLGEKQKDDEYSTNSDTSSSYGVDENKERGNWSSRMEAIFSLLGFCIGLGNMWRFPYLLHRHGGVAFFIPYLILMVVFGLPLTYLELAFGQFASLGPITIWKCVPIFKGVGYAMVAVSTLIAIYYNVIMAWALFYLFASMTMQKDVPWASCDNDWNTGQCSNVTLDLMRGFRGKEKMLSNGTTIHNFSFPKVPSDEFFHRYVLEASVGLDSNLGPPSWRLVLCSFCIWLFIVASLIRGVKSSGKVAYFTATFPFLALFILLGVGMAQNGYGEGLRYFFTPDWKRLYDSRVWLDAATQIIYALGPCIGGLLTLSSYSKFHHKCYQDALVLIFTNIFISILGGLVVFIHLGHMAHSLELKVSEVVEEGPGLIFIVVTHALTLLPVPTIWSVLFFLLLLTLGLDSQFFLVETITTAIIDEKPHRFRKVEVYIVAGLCIFMFLAGLILMTKGGIYLITLMDTFVGSWPALVIGILECIALAWVYGLKNWCKNMEVMLGQQPSKWWQVMWMVITPLSLMVVLTYGMVDFTPASYGHYVLPGWANAIGWVMAALVILIIPAYAIYKVITSGKDVKATLRPTEDWGPALEKHRWLLHYHSKKYNMTPDPILMVQLESLTDSKTYGGIPHGFFLAPGKKMDVTDESRIPINPDMQKKLIKILSSSTTSHSKESESASSNSSYPDTSVSQHLNTAERNLQDQVPVSSETQTEENSPQVPDNDSKTGKHVTRILVKTDHKPTTEESQTQTDEEARRSENTESQENDANSSATVSGDSENNVASSASVERLMPSSDVSEKPFVTVHNDGDTISPCQEDKHKKAHIFGSVKDKSKNKGNTCRDKELILDAVELETLHQNQIHSERVPAVCMSNLSTGIQNPSYEM